MGTRLFSEWADCDSAAGRTCTVSMISGKTVTAVYGLGKPMIDLGDGSGPRGGTVTIPVTLTNVENLSIAALSVDIGYDTSILDAPSSTIGPAGIAAGKETAANTVSAGLYRISVFSLSNNNAIGNGAVVYVTFPIRAVAVLGSTALTNTQTASDPSGNPVSAVGAPGSVTVTQCKAGDCNCDATVGIAEVQSAVNMFLGKATVQSCSDTNGNNKVSIAEIQKVVNNHLGILGPSVLIESDADRETSREAEPMISARGLPVVGIGIEGGHPGDTVSVPINLKNTAGNAVAALSTDIEYDNTRLENPAVIIGNAGQTAGKTVIFNEVSPGVLRIGITSLSNNTVIGDGTVATLSFKIKAGAAQGGVVLKNTPSSSDPLGNELDTAGTNGIINVNHTSPGDVPPGYWAGDFISSLINFGISGGCGSGDFCPDSPVTRAQMAVFMLAALHEAPASSCNGVFGDVNAATVGDTFCRFVEKFATLGITGGCGGGNYCPNSPVTRAQMAVFMTTALNEAPAASCNGTFNDVNAGTVGDVFCRFIEKFATLGITSGCGGGNYCPFDPVTRAQMAVFLTVGFLQ